VTSGRKREFDSELALDAAMHTFWQKGYVGTSLSDLIENMGINKPSIYRTYGNKEALFIKATRRYLETQMKPHLALLNETDISLKKRLKNHMMSIVNMQCNKEHALGCYLVLCQSELISGEIPNKAKQILNEAESLPRQVYINLFNSDPEAIKLGLDSSAQANSLCLYTLLKGTASMARSGVSMSDLEYSVDCILAGIGLH